MAEDRRLAGPPTDRAGLGGGRWPIIIFNLIFRAGNLGIVGFSCVLGILRVFQGFYKEKRGLRVGLAGGKGFSERFLAEGR